MIKHRTKSVKIWREEPHSNKYIFKNQSQVVYDSIFITIDAYI